MLSLLASSSCTGKYIRPSLTTQPSSCANLTTLPSESRKRRDLASEMGMEGYAFSLHEAISLRMVPIRTWGCMLA